MSNMFGGAERKNSQHLRFEEFVPSSGWTEDSDSYCLIINLPGFQTEQVKLEVDDYGHLVASGERQVNEYKHIHFEQSYKVPENSNIEGTTAKFENEILYIVVPKKITAEKEPHHEITNVPEAVQDEKETRRNAGDKVPEAIGEEEVEDKDQYLDAAANGRHESESESDSRHNSDEETNEEEKEEHNDNEEEAKEEEFHEVKMEKQRNESSLLGKLGKALKKNKGIWITAVLAFSFGVLVSQKFQPNEK